MGYIVIHMLHRVIAVHGSSAAPGSLLSPSAQLRRRQTGVWGLVGAGRSGHCGRSLFGFDIDSCHLLCFDLLI